MAGADDQDACTARVQHERYGERRGVARVRRAHAVVGQRDAMRGGERSRCERRVVVEGDDRAGIVREPLAERRGARQRAVAFLVHEHAVGARGDCADRVGDHVAHRAGRFARRVCQPARGAGQVRFRLARSQRSVATRAGSCASRYDRRAGDREQRRAEQCRFLRDGRHDEGGAPPAAR